MSDALPFQPKDRPGTCILALRAAFLALALLLPEPARATTITIVNLDTAGVGLNNTTPAAPVGGNPGTTKGAQALHVFQRAAQLWAAKLVSNVEIKVDSSFAALSCSAGSGVLGSAGPNSFAVNFTNAPRANTWYPQALANSLRGSDVDPASSDIGMQFNGAIGGPTCLAGSSWYMGFDSPAPAGTLSLLTVALHEMAHGLGFLSLVSLVDGSRPNGFDDAYMVKLEDHSTGKLYPAMTNTERLAASTSAPNLHWTGAAVLSANASLTAGVSGGHVQMFAPISIQSGSSVSHFSSALSPNELMEPALTSTPPDLSRTVLLMKDIGWNVCGNGSIEFGEQCDDGNASSADCCTNSCTIAPAGIVCRASSGTCDVQETCTGSGGDCPADTFASAATVCRVSIDVCDAAESCTGSSGACPADVFQSAATECRASTGDCDVAETCTGSTAACPADVLAPAASVCRAATGVCDSAETCDGSTAACPADDFSSAATVCRVSAGPCDVAENCSGSAATCPADAFASAETICRAAGGVCDAVENCTGAAMECPPDTFASALTVCRPSAGVCDAAESCSGAAAACPVDGFASAATACRASAGVCDLAEACDGMSSDCPSDAKSTDVCRADAGACDVAEHCNGSSDECPPDSFEANGTPCADATYCNGVETCNEGACFATGGPCDLDQACDEGLQLCFVGNCPAVPAPACNTAGGSTLQLQRDSDDSRDRFVWKFVKGQMFTQGDFADPTTDSDHTLCFYAGAAAELVAEANLPANAGLFRPLGDDGWSYKDSARTQAGIGRLLVKGGGEGSTKASAKGGGADLPDFPLPFGAAPGEPVIVQLRNSATGSCLSTVFDSPTTDSADQFKAREP